MSTKILAIDDDPGILALLETIFEDHNLEMLQANNSQTGLNMIRENRPNVAIVDIILPGISGLKLLREIKAIDSGISVIMMTGHDSTSNAIEAMQFGAFDYITKPFDISKLQETVDKAIASNLLSRKVRIAEKEKELVKPTTNEDLMIGSSPEMVEIWKMVGKVANSDATVLITGESGTGKELLARAIYNHSDRKNKPFMAVNCAALPEKILESELFGHERGAFTDAHARRIGKFEQCHGGTLFLDEISELSLASQGKLLRVLEDQSFMRVGGNQEIKVDVRIIAATNRSLINEVKAQKFRLDLFYRIRIITFFLPPLRERSSDIHLLIDLFIQQNAEKSNKKIFGIAPEARNYLTAYNWQGNIRELKNAMRAATVYAKSEVLQLEDFYHLDNQDTQHAQLMNDYREQIKNLLNRHFSELCRTRSGDIHTLLTEELEKNLASLAMSHCQDNQVASAKLLGVSRNTLRKWLGIQ
ncbi:MAG TPA: sigma-54 dependent transcriptional regulator [Geopsychrobacteraceae bacterium]|nr:sigma-54 dependent transcriptional regulator [Geopsychrobacteraceae bacterium]